MVPDQSSFFDDSNLPYGYLKSFRKDSVLRDQRDIFHCTKCSDTNMRYVNTGALDLLKLWKVNIKIEMSPFGNGDNSTSPLRVSVENEEAQSASTAPPRHGPNGIFKPNVTQITLLLTSNTTMNPIQNHTFPTGNKLSSYAQSKASAKLQKELGGLAVLFRPLSLFIIACVCSAIILLVLWERSQKARRLDRQRSLEARARTASERNSSSPAETEDSKSNSIGAKPLSIFDDSDVTCDIWDIYGDNSDNIKKPLDQPDFESFNPLFVSAEVEEREGHEGAVAEEGAARHEEKDEDEDNDEDEDEESGFFTTQIVRMSAPSKTSHSLHLHSFIGGTKFDVSSIDQHGGARPAKGSGDSDGSSDADRGAVLGDFSSLYEEKQDSNLTYSIFEDEMHRHQQQQQHHRLRQNPVDYDWAAGVNDRSISPEVLDLSQIYSEQDPFDLEEDEEGDEKEGQEVHGGGDAPDTESQSANGNGIDVRKGKKLRSDDERSSFFLEDNPLKHSSTESATKHSHDSSGTATVDGSAMMPHYPSFLAGILHSMIGGASALTSSSSSSLSFQNNVNDVVDADKVASGYVEDMVATVSSESDNGDRETGQANLTVDTEAGQQSMQQQELDIQKIISAIDSLARDIYKSLLNNVVVEQTPDTTPTSIGEKTKASSVSTVSPSAYLTKSRKPADDVRARLAEILHAIEQSSIDLQNQIDPKVKTYLKNVLHRLEESLEVDSENEDASGSNTHVPADIGGSSNGSGGGGATVGDSGVDVSSAGYQTAVGSISTVTPSIKPLRVADSAPLLSESSATAPDGSPENMSSGMFIMNNVGAYIQRFLLASNNADDSSGVDSERDTALSIGCSNSQSNSTNNIIVEVSDGASIFDIGDSTSAGSSAIGSQSVTSSADAPTNMHSMGENPAVGATNNNLRAWTINRAASQLHKQQQQETQQSLIRQSPQTIESSAEMTASDVGLTAVSPPETSADMDDENHTFITQPSFDASLPSSSFSPHAGPQRHSHGVSRSLSDAATDDGKSVVLRRVVETRRDRESGIREAAPKDFDLSDEDVIFRMPSALDFAESQRERNQQLKKEYAALTDEVDSALKKEEKAAARAQRQAQAQLTVETNPGLKRQPNRESIGTARSPRNARLMQDCLDLSVAILKLQTEDASSAATTGQGVARVIINEDGAPSSYVPVRLEKLRRDCSDLSTVITRLQKEEEQVLVTEPSSAGDGDGDGDNIENATASKTQEANEKGAFSTPKQSRQRPNSITNDPSTSTARDSSGGKSSRRPSPMTSTEKRLEGLKQELSNLKEIKASLQQSLFKLSDNESTSDAISAIKSSASSSSYTAIPSKQPLRAEKGSRSDSELLKNKLFRDSLINLDAVSPATTAGNSSSTARGIGSSNKSHFENNNSNIDSAAAAAIVGVTDSTLTITPDSKSRSRSFTSPRARSHDGKRGKVLGVSVGDDSSACTSESQLDEAGGGSGGGENETPPIIMRRYPTRAMMDSFAHSPFRSSPSSSGGREGVGGVGMFGPEGYGGRGGGSSVAATLGGGNNPLAQLGNSGSLGSRSKSRSDHSLLSPATPIATLAPGTPPPTVISPTHKSHRADDGQDANHAFGDRHSTAAAVGRKYPTTSFIKSHHDIRAPNATSPRSTTAPSSSYSASHSSSASPVSSPRGARLLQQDASNVGGSAAGAALLSTPPRKPSIALLNRSGSSHLYSGAGSDIVGAGVSGSGMRPGGGVIANNTNRLPLFSSPRTPESPITLTEILQRRKNFDFDLYDRLTKKADGSGTATSSSGEGGGRLALPQLSPSPQQQKGSRATVSRSSQILRRASAGDALAMKSPSTTGRSTGGGSSAGGGTAGQGEGALGAVDSSTSLPRAATMPPLHHQKSPLPNAIAPGLSPAGVAAAGFGQSQTVTSSTPFPTAISIPSSEIDRGDASRGSSGAQNNEKSPVNLMSTARTGSAFSPPNRALNLIASPTALSRTSTSSSATAAAAAAADATNTATNASKKKRSPKTPSVGAMSPLPTSSIPAASFFVRDERLDAVRGKQQDASKRKKSSADSGSGGPRKGVPGSSSSGNDKQQTKSKSRSLLT